MTGPVADLDDQTSPLLGAPNARRYFRFRLLAFKKTQLAGITGLTLQRHCRSNRLRLRDILHRMPLTAQTQTGGPQSALQTAGRIRPRDAVDRPPVLDTWATKLFVRPRPPPPESRPARSLVCHRLSVGEAEPDNECPSRSQLLPCPAGIDRGSRPGPRTNDGPLSTKTAHRVAAVRLEGNRAALHSAQHWSDAWHSIPPGVAA